MADNSRGTVKNSRSRLYRKTGTTPIKPNQESVKIDQVGEGAEFDPLTQKYLVAQQTTMSVSGPLPHSTEFASYNQTLPGAADRIVKMAEKEQDSRLFENRWLLGIKTASTLFGQGIAACLVYVSLNYSYHLAIQGKEKTAIAISTTTIGAILAAFIGPKLINSRGNKDE